MIGANHSHKASQRELEHSRWESLTLFMRARSMSVAILAPLCLSLLLAWVDYTTTWELSVFVFYAVPILMAVWWAGSRAGYGMAVICGVLWWASNYATHPYETTLGYVWATVSRGVFFGVVAYAATAVRKDRKSVV